MLPLPSSSHAGVGGWGERTYTVLAALWAQPILSDALEGRREIVNCVCVPGHLCSRYVVYDCGKAVCVVHLCCVLMCGDWRCVFMAC